MLVDQRSSEQNQIDCGSRQELGDFYYSPQSRTAFLVAAFC